MKIRFIILFLFVANGMLMAQNYTLRTREQLLDENYITGASSYSSNEYTNIALNSKRFYFMANDYRDRKDYENALRNYEIALSMFDWGAFYYQYGVCLMDIGDLSDAEKAFKKAINRIPHHDPYTIIAPYYPAERGKNPIYSFDNNGIVRELYFSYYNLACIYSLQNKLEECKDYLLTALQYGYPYLNHIFSDSDLANLFNSGFARQITEEINRTYNGGSVNTVSGKTYGYRGSPNDWTEYEFIDNTRIRRHDMTSDDRDRIQYGTYRIVNYHVIINYNRATGQKGHNAIGAGTITVFETYTPYDIRINETEYISLEKMARRYGWEQQ